MIKSQSQKNILWTLSRTDHCLGLKLSKLYNSQDNIHVRIWKWLEWTTRQRAEGRKKLSKTAIVQNNQCELLICKEGITST